MTRQFFIAASVCVTMLVGFVGVASAKTITVYPSNYPNANVRISKGSCTVNGQTGTVVTMANGSEGCAITSSSVAPNPNTSGAQEAPMNQEAQQPEQKK